MALSKFTVPSTGKDSRKTKNQLLVWPSPGEIEGFNCVFCNLTPSYPFMQCTNGHLICLDEATSFKFCPGPVLEDGEEDLGPNSRCKAQLTIVKLRWYKWMSQRAIYECQIAGCNGAVVGQKDRKHHMKICHSQKLEELSLVETPGLGSDRVDSKVVPEADVKKEVEEGSDSDLSEFFSKLDCWQKISDPRPYFA